MRTISSWNYAKRQSCVRKGHLHADWAIILVRVRKGLALTGFAKKFNMDSKLSNNRRDWLSFLGLELLRSPSAPPYFFCHQTHGFGRTGIFWRVEKAPKPNQELSLPRDDGLMTTAAKVRTISIWNYAKRQSCVCKGHLRAD